VVHIRTSNHRATTAAAPCQLSHFCFLVCRICAHATVWLCRQGTIFVQVHCIYHWHNYKNATISDMSLIILFTVVVCISYSSYSHTASYYCLAKIHRALISNKGAALHMVICIGTLCTRPIRGSDSSLPHSGSKTFTINLLPDGNVCFANS
jgi:hypothetical protein